MMKRTVILLFGLIAMACIVCSCGETGVTHDKSGDHDIQISGTPPVPFSPGNELRASGYTTQEGVCVYTFKGNGYDIKLEDEELKVNGKRYLIPHKDDSIRIHDGRVWFNGQPAKPEPERASSDSNSPGPK
jgi:hypothetical protein